MGFYFNPEERSLRKVLNNDIFIDKSLIFTELDKKFDSEGGFLCVSRPRRFGKTVVGNLDRKSVV